MVIYIDTDCVYISHVDYSIIIGTSRINYNETKLCQYPKCIVYTANSQCEHISITIYSVQLLFKVVDGMCRTILDLVHSRYKDVLTYSVRSHPIQKAFQVLLINMNYFCLESISTNVQHMKQLMWFNERVAMQKFNFILISILYVHSHIFINNDTPLYFVSLNMLLKATQLQNRCISLSICIYCTCTPYMQCGKPTASL